MFPATPGQISILINTFQRELGHINHAGNAHFVGKLSDVSIWLWFCILINGLRSNNTLDGRQGAKNKLVAICQNLYVIIFVTTKREGGGQKQRRDLVNICMIVMTTLPNNNKSSSLAYDLMQSSTELM